MLRFNVSRRQPWFVLRQTDYADLQSSTRSPRDAREFGGVVRHEGGAAADGCSGEQLIEVSDGGTLLFNAPKTHRSRCNVPPLASHQGMLRQPAAGGEDF